jgi:DNA polymerase IV (DinB-like DNA polymerase)
MVIMHVDLDYFYAQCEESLNPAIRGRSVIVCVFSGRTENSGVVSTCNYQARKFGVRAGIPIVRAKKLLEATESVFIPMNRRLYEEISDRVMELLRNHADQFEKVGIDEAYLDVSTKTNGDLSQAEKIALQIKQEIVQLEHITCSIGVGPNKLLAKIASDENKPNGLKIVRSEDVKGYLAELAVGRIPGVGKKVEEKLSKLQISKIGELSRVNPTVLIETFGRSLGSYLYQAALGMSAEPVKDRYQPTQFSRIATLKVNTRQAAEIIPLLDELTLSLTSRLTEENMMCKSISIIAITDNLRIHSKSKTLESPTHDEKAIRQSSRELLEQFLQATPHVVIRRIGVKLSGLSKRGGQIDLGQFLRRV